MNPKLLISDRGNDRRLSSSPGSFRKAQEKYLMQLAPFRVVPLRVVVLGALLLLSLLLSGCIRSDLAINFSGQRGGEIVQQIQLADSLAGRGLVEQSWLEQIQHQARQVGGYSQRLNPQELKVVIPFDSPADLARRLNQFLQPLSRGNDASSRRSTPLPPLPNHLEITGQNFLLLLRNHLSYDLDLRDLGVQSPSGEVLLSPAGLLDLHLSLKTPWGARSLRQEKLEQGPRETTLMNPGVTRQGTTLTWTLQPGYKNHLEASFWYPSPIGWGTIAIALFIGAGWYVKYGLKPTE